MATKKIGTDEARVGMVLAQPINDAQGRIIMSEGSRLTPVHVKRLDRWGVTELLIYDGEEPAAGEQEAAESTSESAAAQLDQDYMRETAALFNLRFQDVTGNTLMERLKKSAFKAVVLAGRNGIPGVR